ncbi:hypothetical protein [Devosia naphthalenivorans]|uniref:hypothetical protein n=1 Tax=Devosia naphthalenivorans TaxID=2082392 RepID=UPI000D3AC2CF|nr:hypothetical protein [Devosia naphthalenivorans]
MKADRVFWAFVCVELLLIGALIGSMTTTGIDATNAPYGALEYFLFRYQTMLAGAAALVAALWTTSAVRKQISSAEAQHQLERFDSREGELDALQGLVEYLDSMKPYSEYVLKWGRKINEPPLNLQYRVSTHTSYRVSNRFSEITDMIEKYNTSDRRAVVMYSDPGDGSTQHSAMAMMLLGAANALADFSRERIDEIMRLAPKPT